MRVTHGNRVRKYLYDVRAGERKAVAMYQGDVKLWPSLADTISGIVLDVAALDGTADWAWWVHALDAVANGSSDECHIKLVAGGREYRLGSTYGVWPLAAFDGGATVSFGDNGMLLDKLRVGDEVKLVLKIPPRLSKSYNMTEGRYFDDAGEYLALPFLKGTGLKVVWWKWKKRPMAGRDFRIQGQPSGQYHYSGYCHTARHKKYMYMTRMLPENTHKWVNNAYYNDVVPGDTGLLVWSQAIGNGADPELGGVQLRWPGFNRTIRMRVSAIIRHG